MFANSYRFIFIAFLTVTYVAVPLASKSRKINWLSGTVVDVSVYARGATSGKNSSAQSRRGETQYRRKDLWWEYSIRSSGQTYVGVLRSSPVKCGLKINTPIKYFVSRDRLYLINPGGKRFELRILRKLNAEVPLRQAPVAPPEKYPSR